MRDRRRFRVFCTTMVEETEAMTREMERMDTKEGEVGAGRSDGGQAVGTEVAAQAEDEEKEKKKMMKKAAKEAKKLAAIAKKKAKEEEMKANTGKDNAKKQAAKEAAERKKAEKEAEAKEIQRLIEIAKATPKGAKKSMSESMEKGYHPQLVEAAWYDWWESCGYFQAEPTSDKPKFVMVIPPPNVTGTLHLGHALTDSIQDALARWKRMSGYEVLWLPGTDHAGIATQTVVEKKLAREQQISRHDIGRDNFLKEVYKYVDDYGGRICRQMRRLGCSLDWSRERFTMDEQLSTAVGEAFVRLHSEGLIYRENRLVNWDCTLKTAISDIEVDYIDIPGRTMLKVPGYSEPVEFGCLTSFAYQIEDGNGEVVVATTRIETMLGDTAVAVHPEDERYAHLHGKFVIHPFSGRRLPIITDAILVDMSFGTGAVKITPAHDPNDFATGKRHGLEFINVFTDEGMINEHGGMFEGQKRFETRIAVVEALKEKGLYRGRQDNPMRLGLCSRSKDVIEPMLKPQWWVNCTDMAAEACKAVRDGDLKIIPREFEATWFRWLENIRDWCISRQLWWGHRIPAYYVILDGEESKAGKPGTTAELVDHWVSGRTQEEAEAKAKELFPGRSFHLEQDEDVLDTWFSSGLFPFSTLGWPTATKDMDAFYPNSLLETGHDILFFWVARMVMMGMKLTGKIPFNTVYLHSMVRDAHGRKMSKSLGNVIDPVQVIEGITLDELHATLHTGNLDPKEIARATEGQKADFPNGIPECGTDALRMTLLAYTSQARDVNLDINRVVAYRHWCNKLWNAIRFAMINLGDNFKPPSSLDFSQAPMECRWILSRLNAATVQVNKALSDYTFSDATTALYNFWQYELCDVFIELMKPTLAQEDSEESSLQKRLTRETLWCCLENGLRLLHPFMPYVTEELWQRLPKSDATSRLDSLVVAPFPQENSSLEDEVAEEEMRILDAVVRVARSIRSNYGLTKQRPSLYLLSRAERVGEVVSRNASVVTTLSSSSEVVVVDDASKIPSGCAVEIVNESSSVYLLLTGVINPAEECAKMEKKIKAIEEQVSALQGKLAAPGYEAKVPEWLQKENQEKLQRLVAEQESAKIALVEIQKLV